MEKRSPEKRKQKDILLENQVKEIKWIPGNSSELLSELSSETKILKIISYDTPTSDYEELLLNCINLKSLRILVIDAYPPNALKEKAIKLLLETVVFIPIVKLSLRGVLMDKKVAELFGKDLPEFSSLKHLILEYHNTLESDDHIRPFYKAIKQLKGLTSLEIYVSNCLRATNLVGAKFFSQALRELTELSSLKLTLPHPSDNENKLGPFFEVFEAIGELKLKSFEIIQYRSNEIISPFLESLAKALHNLQLVEFSLTIWNVDLKGLKHVGEALDDMKSLKILKLKGNATNGAFLDGVFQSPQNVQVEKLVIEVLDQKRNFVDFAKRIEKIKTLKYLDFKFQLSGEEIEALINLLSSCKTLEGLYFETGDNLKDAPFEKFLKKLETKFPTLRELKLHVNEKTCLSDKSLKKLFEICGTFKNLRVLDLKFSNQQFTVGIFERFVEDFKHCKMSELIKIRFEYDSHNEFSIEKINPFLSQLKRWLPDLQIIIEIEEFFKDTMI